MENEKKLIAEFMEVEVRNNSHYLKNIDDEGNKYFSLLSDLQYNISWNDLMPVVEKIESIDHVIIDIFKEATKVKFYKSDIQEWTTTQWNSQSKISHVYKACVEFISHYNSIKP